MPADQIIDQLIAARLTLGWSQSELGRQSGLDQAAVVRLESRKHVPRIETVQRLADAMGCTFVITVEPRPGRRV